MIANDCLFFCDVLVDVMVVGHLMLLSPSLPPLFAIVSILLNTSL